MNKDHAMAELGVNAGAAVAEIEAAYRRRKNEVREIYSEDREERDQAFKRLDEARDALISERGGDNRKPGPVDEIASGTVVAGRFAIQHELGRGRAGTVWLAHDSRRERMVALKFLPDDVREDEGLVEALKRTTHSWSELNHANIARIYEFVEAGSHRAISMEYVDGLSLSEARAAKPHQIFEVNDLKPWVRELCDALEHAHRHARFRYGLKPANLRVDRAGHLKLAEFGISRFLDDWAGRPRSSGQPAGAPDEGSPEAFQDHSMEAAADVYALGAMLYELLTGTPPFPVRESGTRGDVPPSMADRRAERGVKGEAIPKTWERTVAACLAKEPAQRPQGPLEVLRSLESDEVEPPRGDFRWQYVFTQQGEGGLQPGKAEGWPAVAADFLRPKSLVALRSGEASNLMAQLENIERARGNSGHFITLGLERRPIPDAEIHDYLTYRFARQTALQLRFNHWNDAQGFLSEPPPFDFDEQVRQPATLERWLLTDDHLQLSRPILPEKAAEGNWKPIIQDWVEVMPRLASLAAQRWRQADRLAELERLSMQRYDETFRGLGVEGFYDRAASQRREYARFISARIERELFADWQTGVRSMLDVTRALEALRVFLEKRSADMGVRIAAHQEYQEKARGLVQSNREAHARVGRFDLFLHRRKSRLNAHSEYLRSLYVQRTFVEACTFERSLLEELVAEVDRLGRTVKEAATLANAGAADFETRCAEGCNVPGRIYGAARVHEFGRRLDKDQGEQMRHAQAVRAALAGEAGLDPTFSRLAGISRQKVLELMKRECEASARKVHEHAIAMSRDVGPLVGGNILGHLQQEFAGRANDFREFIHELVNRVRQFLEFDGEEASATGDRFDTFVSRKVQRRVVIMPKAEAGTFGGLVKDLIHQRFSRDVRLDFVENAKNAGEITFLSITNLCTPR